jgi:hypothetical protein
MDNFETIKVINETIHIRKQQRNSVKSKEINLDSDSVINLVSALRDLVETLITNKGDWTITENINIITVVRETIVTLKKFKKLDFISKKNLVMSLVKLIVNRELKDRNIDEVIKATILKGIDEVLDPAIEVGIMSMTGELNVKCIKSMFCF